jgi:hypothetical protein
MAPGIAARPERDDRDGEDRRERYQRDEESRRRPAEIAALLEVRHLPA